MITKEQILSNLMCKRKNCEETLQDLAEIGFCPNLLNDDNGHWAIAFDGFQSVASGEESVDVSTSFFVESVFWKDSIDEALIYALTN